MKRAFSSEAKNSSSSFRATYSGLIPIRSRARTMRFWDLLHSAAANIPRSLAKQSLSHSTKARSAQREEIGLKHALLVGTAVNQCSRGLPDSFRRRAPIFSGKPGDSAQLPAPSLSREDLARCHLEFEKNSPLAVYPVYQPDRN